MLISAKTPSGGREDWREFRLVLRSETKWSGKNEKYS